MSVEAPKVKSILPNQAHPIERGWAALSGVVIGGGVLYPPLYVIGLALGAAGTLPRIAIRLGERWGDDEFKTIMSNYFGSAEQGPTTVKNSFPAGSTRSNH